jgi:hypothetical protein
MGQKQSGTSRVSRSATSSTNPFKLFEYQCPNCNTKRPIQYFYRNETFLPQAPRVVCGECNTSVAVEPFKTVEYHCPWCKKWHKVRLPAKPIPIKMYNVSVASCGCGFRGEVPVGRLMDVSCSVCWGHKRELRGVWTEDGDEIKTYCETCQGYQRAFAREPKKKKEEEAADMEYSCENCFRHRPISAEELLRNQGLAICSYCGWVGYPEAVPKGQLEAKAKQQGDRGKRDKSKSREKPKRHGDKTKSSQDNLLMQSPVPQPQPR